MKILINLIIGLFVFGVWYMQRRADAQLFHYPDDTQAVATYSLIRALAKSLLVALVCLAAVASLGGPLPLDDFLKLCFEHGGY